MKGATLTLLSRLVSALLQGAVLVILARGTSLGDFGRFSVALALGSIVSGILTLGLPTFALKTPLNPHIKSVLLNASFLQCGAIAAIAFGYSFVETRANAGWSWLAAAATYTAAEIIANMVQSMLFSEIREGALSVLMLQRRGIPMLLVIGALALRVDLFFALSVASALVIAFSALLAKAGRPSLNGVTSMVRSSRHYWSSGLYSMLQQFDVVIIRFILGSPAAAGYSAAFRLSTPIHIVTLFITSRGMPAITREQANRAPLRAERTMIRVGIAYATVLAALSPVMLFLGPLIVGARFEGYALLFVLLFIANAVGVVNQVLSAILFTKDEGRWVARATLISTVFGLGAIAAGAMLGGVVAATVGSILLQLVWLTLTVPRAWSARDFHNPKSEVS